MSQVRKLNENKIEKHAWGKVILDSDVYDMNDEATRKAFETYLRDKGAEYGYFTSGIMDLLRSGNDYVGSRIGNTSNYSGPDKKVAEKSSNRSTAQMWWDAFLNTPVQQGKDATHYVNAFTYAPVVVSPSKNKKDNRQVAFVYDTIDGNQVYAKGDPKNETILSRFNDYYDYLENPAWIDSNEWMQALEDNDSYLKTWWNNFSNENGGRRALAKAEIDNAIAEVQSKPWDKVSSKTKRLLSYFNIGEPAVSSSQSSEDNIGAATRSSLKDSGINPDAYYVIGDNFEKDRYGVWRLKPDATFDIGIPEFLGKNIYFNSDFFNSRYAAGKNLDALRGLTYYNGALYTNDSPELAQILNAEGGYNSLVKKGLFKEADDIILTRFTDANLENPKKLEDNQYSEFLNLPTHRYSSLNGKVGLKGRQLQPGEQIIQYINLAEPEFDGPYNTYRYKFALLKPNGGYQDLVYDELEDIGGESTPYVTKGKVVDPTSRLNGYVYEDPTGKFGEPTEIRIYQDPVNPRDNVILHIPDISASGVDSGMDIKLPKDLAQILIDSKDRWLPRVLGNPENRREFELLISDLVRSGIRQIAIPAQARNAWKRLGFDGIELDRLMAAWKRSRRGLMGNRRSEMLVYSPTFNRNGGKMQYIAKLATGGFAGGNTDAAIKTTKKYDVKVDNTKNAHGILEFDKWTTADAADLGALVADLTSLGITIADPTNVGGMVSGMASSLARFDADRMRGTKGAWGNLGLNLLMDTATLLPLVGDATKAAKTAISIKKALPTIIKLASLYGMGDAVVNTATKIANGEKFTVRDLSVIANALTAGVALGKVGGFGKKARTQRGELKFKDQEISVGTGENATKVKVTGDQLEAASKSGDTRKALETYVKNDPKVAGKTDEEIKKAVDALMKNPNIIRKTTKTESKKLRIKKERGESTTKTNEANGNWIHDWWYGVGEMSPGLKAKARGEANASRAGYLARLRHEGVSREVGKNKMFEEITKTRQEPGLISEYIAGPEDSGDTVVNGFVDVITRTRQRNPQYYRGFTTMPVAPNLIVVKPDTDAKYNFLPGTSPAFYDPSEIAFKKDGGVIKAQGGWDLSKLSSFNGTAGSRKPFVFDPSSSLSYNEQLNNWRNPYGLLGSIATVKFNSSSSTNGSEAPEKEWGWGKDVPSFYRYIEPALGMLQYIGVGKYQNKQRDLSKKGIEAGRYQLTPTTFNQYRTDSPELQRLNNQLVSMQMQNYPATTSDPIQYAATKLMRDAQLAKGLAENTAKQSLFAWNALKENTAIGNQNIQNAVQTANANRQINATINSALVNPDLQLNAERKSSFENKLLEWRSQINKQTNLINQLEYKRIEDALESAYNKDIAKLISDDIYNKWVNLGSAGQAQYSGIEDWLQKEYSDQWSSGRWGKWFDNRNKQYATDLRNAQMRIMISPWLLRTAGIHHEGNLPTYKKGGRLHGKTRYTLEPDERIWIENNKAVHKQIAKLTDNTIKLLLSALNKK